MSEAPAGSAAVTPASEAAPLAAKAGGTDNLDAIVSEWVEQRPDFDARPLAIFSRLLRLDRHIDHLRRSVFAQYELEGWAFEMVTELRRARPGHQLTAGQLMKKTLVSSGTITNRIDRLEELNLVRRVRDKHDGRVVIVQLTDKGLKVADEAMAALLAKQWELLAPFSQEELRTVRKFLRDLLAHLDATYGTR